MMRSTQPGPPVTSRGESRSGALRRGPPLVAGLGLGFGLGFGAGLKVEGSPAASEAGSGAGFGAGRARRGGGGRSGSRLKGSIPVSAEVRSGDHAELIGSASQHSEPIMAPRPT